MITWHWVSGDPWKGMDETDFASEILLLLRKMDMDKFRDSPI